MNVRESRILLNNRLVADEEARVSLADIDVAYGYGVYETLKVRNGVLFFPDFHEERLMNSAQLLGIRHELKPGQLVQGLRDLMAWGQSQSNSQPGSWNIKVILVGHTGRPGDVYAFLTNPLYPDRRQLKHGGTASLYMGERHFPQAKSLSMLMSTLAFRQAQEMDCYDALLVNHRREVTEGTRTNIFFLPMDRSGSTTELPPVVYTPPGTTVLEGITRRTIITALKNHGIACVEKPLSLENLASGTISLWVSSTSTKIMPISRIMNPLGQEGYQGPRHALNPEPLHHLPGTIEMPLHPGIRMIQKIYDMYLEDYAAAFHRGE